MPTAADANNLALCNYYPQEEPRIVRQLVRAIGSARTWQDMIEASDALFQVELRAKQMREERDTQRVVAAVQSAQESQQSRQAKAFSSGLQQIRGGSSY